MAHGIVIIVPRDEVDDCFAYFSKPSRGLDALAAHLRFISRTATNADDLRPSS
jgi:hypothetical protein